MANLYKNNLVIPQGVTWAIRWPILDSNGNPANTVGWTVKSQVRKTPDSDEVLYEWSSTLGNASVFDSFVELRLEPEDSSPWRWGAKPVLFDVELTNPSNEVFRVVQGTIELSREITR